MTRLAFRVYRGKGRMPRDFVAKVFATDEADAIAQVKKQPMMKGRDLVLEAVPSHVRKAGK